MNRSKQKEAILDVLRNTKSHPTAEWIYTKAREEIPNLSLGTVYRNLSLFVSEGMISKISVGDGNDHLTLIRSRTRISYAKVAEVYSISTSRLTRTKSENI